MNGDSSGAPAVVTRFQNQGSALNGEGRSNNENANGVPVTTILINNALSNFFDSALIDRSAAVSNGSNTAFQLIALDCESNPSGTDRTTRPVFGFNYFRTCNQAVNVNANPITTSNQRRCVIINGSTGEVLANLQPGVIRATTENNILIDAINSVTLADLVIPSADLEPADVLLAGGAAQPEGTFYQLSLSGDLSNNSLDAYMQWADEQNIPTSSRGTSDDPDGDQIDNFSEYAYGTNPIVADANNVVPRLERSPETGTFQFVFQRSKTATVQPFALMSSSTLRNFSHFSPPENDIVVENLEDIVRVRVNLP